MPFGADVLRIADVTLTAFDFLESGAPHVIDTRCSNLDQFLTKHETTNYLCKWAR